jgi:hypothetical protein
MKITAAVLLAATLVGPERRIAPPAYGPAYGTQFLQALASDGENFLVVWNGIGGVHTTVVDESGSPKASSRALFLGNFVHAAWAGDAYVLAWYDDQRQTTLTARVSRDGELISQPVAVQHTGNVFPRAIGANPSGTLFVVSVGESAKAILAGSQNASIELPAFAHTASVVAVAGGFVVVTGETTTGLNGTPSTTVRATRISNAGAIEKSVVVSTLPNHAQFVHAATDGERIGVAFVARRRAASEKERLYTFTLDASTLDGDAHPPVIVSSDFPQVVPIPGGFATAFTELPSESALLLTTIPFGSESRRTMQIGTVPGGGVLMATNGSTVFGVWSDYRFSPSYEYSTMNLFGLTLDATASVPKSDVRPATISAVAQARPSIASAGETALVAWVDFTKTVTGELLAMRVDAHGNRLDRRPIAIATGLPQWYSPAAVFTGEVWIVAWSVQTTHGGDTRTYMRRIALDGTVLDTAPVELAASGGIVAASNGTVTMLIAGDTMFRLSRAGERLGEQVLPVAPSAAGSNGRDFLLVWTEGWDWWQFPSPNYIDLHAMRYDANGVPMDAVKIDVAVSGANEHNPIVTSDGLDFLILYQHEIRDANTLRAKRVRATGVLADHTPAEDGSLVAEGLVGDGVASFSAAPLGDGYIAVYARDGVKIAIEAVALDPRGAVAEEASALGGSDWWWPPWTSAGGRWIAYTRVDPAMGDIARLFVRTAGEDGARRRSLRR